MTARQMDILAAFMTSKYMDIDRTTFVSYEEWIRNYKRIRKSLSETNEEMNNVPEEEKKADR